MTFPAGTEVNDRLEKELSHVLPSGEWRTIAKFGRSASSAISDVSEDRPSVASSSTYVPAILFVSILVVSLALLGRRRARVGSGIALLVGLSFVLDTATMLYSSREKMAHAACGAGCNIVKCFEAINGDFYVIEDDTCCKIVENDPGNSNTLGGASYTSRFEAVNGIIGCSPPGSGIGGMPAACEDPTGNWSVAGTACREFCSGDT